MKRKIRKILILGLAVLMLAAQAHAASTFPDVDENASYAEAAEYLNEIGIMQGDENGNFNPNKAVSRAEMAVIICRLMEEDSEPTNTAVLFSDVPENHWANTYIIRAASLGIVNGYGNGTFGPSDQVTYEQAISMIVRAMNLEEHAIAMGGYPDGYILVAMENHYLDLISAGKGDILTRAQIAVILKNATTI